MKVSDVIDTWMFRSYQAPAESLAIYRIVFSAFLLLVAMPKFLWLADLPDSFHAPPPGPFALVSSFPSAPVFIVLELLLATAAVSLLLGYRTRAASLIVGLTMMVGLGFVYSLGKINHGMLLFNIVPLVLAFSSWGDRFSLDARRGVRSGESGWPLALMALSTGLMMLTASMGKAVTGWLDPGTHAARAWIIKNLALDDRAPLLAENVLQIDNGAFWTAVDYFTVALEGGLVVAVVWPLAFRLMLAFFVLFHVGIYLTMAIGFGTAIVAYGAFVQWTGLIPGGTGQQQGDAAVGLRRSVVVGIMVSGAAYWVVHNAVGPPLSALWGAAVPTEVGIGTLVPFIGGVVLSIGYIWTLGKSMIRGRARVRA